MKFGPERLAALLVVAAGLAAAPAGADAALPPIQVDGDHLVAGGAPVRLLGVNRSGSEYACSVGGGFGVFQGPVGKRSIAAIRSWRANAVALPLNEQCWLGSPALKGAFSGARYRREIKGFVGRLGARGIYVVLRHAVADLLPAGRNSLPGARVVSLGHSVKGRGIRALRLGDPRSPRKALVVGAIHGDETAGLKVVRALRRRWDGVAGMDVWTVYTVNPDGVARDTRRNARGVDLNRNFGFRWRGGLPRTSGYYPGPRPFSEPESRLVRRLVERLRPRVSIYYHQPWGQVLAPCAGGEARLERRYSRVSGLPLKRCRGQHLPGTAVKWQEHRFPGSDAFVVELPGGRLGAAAARRNARAAIAAVRLAG